MSILHSMTKEEFYESLVHSEENLISLFERYEDDNYPELKEYVLERIQADFAFPKDKKQPSQGTPLIPKVVHKRVSVVARTIEEGIPYSQENLCNALNYIESVRYVEQIRN